MHIGSTMATLREKAPKMDPKKRFFLKNPPGFWTFETSSWILTSNRPFWSAPIYRDINFVLKCLPARCVAIIPLTTNNFVCVCYNVGYGRLSHPLDSSGPIIHSRTILFLQVRWSRRIPPKSLQYHYYTYVHAIHQQPCAHPNVGYMGGCHAHIR